MNRHINVLIETLMGLKKAASDTALAAGKSGREKEFHDAMEAIRVMDKLVKEIEVLSMLKDLQIEAADGQQPIGMV